jgi:hypothetical protein
MVLATGATLCGRCRISATSIEDWNNFMEPIDLQAMILRLERPISVLKSIAVFTTDKGLKALAATTLKGLNELDVSECFTDDEAAEECRKLLEGLTLK